MIITIINTILSLLSCIQLARAIYANHLAGFKAKTRSVAYLLSDNVREFERKVRLSLYSILIMDMILLSHMVNRIIIGFPPFVSDYVMYSSLILFTCMFIIGNVCKYAYK